jgi:Fe2+ or Zn2+ uptake regulation protein
MSLKELMESNVPHQVMFHDGEGMCAGILFQNHIICGCCGGVFSVEDVVDMARDNKVEAIRLFKTWVDLSDEIFGDANDETEAVVV